MISCSMGLMETVLMEEEISFGSCATRSLLWCRGKKEIVRCLKMSLRLLILFGSFVEYTYPFLINK